MKVSKTLLGTVIETGKYLVFFGNRNAQLLPLQNEYPEFNFLKIKQTHSDCIVEASEALVEADSHWRQEKNRPLLLQQQIVALLCWSMPNMESFAQSTLVGEECKMKF